MRVAGFSCHLSWDSVIQRDRRRTHFRLASLSKVPLDRSKHLHCVLLAAELDMHEAPRSFLVGVQFRLERREEVVRARPDYGVTASIVSVCTSVSPARRPLSCGTA